MKLYRLINNKKMVIKQIVNVKIFLTLSVLAVIISCSSFKDTTGQTNLKSKYNEDNIIFKTNRQFNYDVLWIKEKDTLPIKNATGEEIKQIILSIIPGKFFNQTKITWQYANEKSFIVKTEITGIVEDSTNVWIHPPRSGMPFVYIESAPFPEIKHPLNLGTKWNSETFIPKGQYDVINLSGKMNNNWEIKERIKLETSYKNYDSIWKIESFSKSCLGTGKNEFYFDENDGFVKMIYTFPNNEILIFELSEIK